MRFYALQMTNGGVAIMRTDVADPMTKVAEWDPPLQARVTGVWREIQLGDIPTDRTFRDAWVDQGSGAIDHDMDKAKVIQQARIERAKAGKMSDLAAQWNVESAKGNTAQANAIRSQIATVEAATVDVSKASTPEALKALWPAELAIAEEVAVEAKP